MILKGKKALIFGLANHRSIATGIARTFKAHGARLGISYASKVLEKRVLPLSEELKADFCFCCDLTNDQDILKSKQQIKDHWQDFDILVHSVAFAPAEELKGRFVNTSRQGFQTAMDISVYTLISLCQHLADLMSPQGSVLTMTYHGSRQVIPNYNIMGVAKAALEASVRYLAADLGEQGIRVNAISAGPIKTLAAAGISGFRKILGHIEEHAPLKKNITQEDVGRTALFLASDLSSAITGEIIYVDAGFHVMGL